ncbi:IDEAL domain-containing protein [Lysinibacillus odysseyi]|uniref:IDEAL domain-containing protein n=1 Tax=Lysinibacillus odysseyi TaxID=202611 RepID=UPI0007AB22A3|nr:IDEAL domain-containing protein [Lysinibacillus odysseyi]
MKEFINAIVKMAREVAIEHHGFVEEDGFLFSPSTILLVGEIEESNRQHLIDQALASGNKDMFLELIKN